MLCKDADNEIEVGLFCIEFAHHMRQFCGGSGYYRDNLYCHYAGLTGLDVGYVARVAAGECDPCSKILDLMRVDEIVYTQRKYKERDTITDADSSD